MDHLWNQLTKHDGLIIVKFLGSTVYQFYFTKVLLVLFLLIQFSCQLIQIYLFTNELSVLQFIQYSPVFFIMFYAILAALILLMDPKVVENRFDGIDMWPIDYAVESTKEKIKNEMNIVSIFVIINATGAISAGFAALIFNHYDYTMFLPVKYFIDYHPKYSNILITIYKASITFSAFTFIAHACQVIYCTQHLKYQFWMLMDLINGILIPENNDTLHVRLVDDSEYQRLVKTRLIDFIKRHVELLIPTRKKFNDISNYVAYFSVCGLLFLASIVYVLASDTFIYYDYRYLGAVGLFGTTTFTSLITAGQSIETIVENLYYLLQQIDWYLMNNQNQKMYLMALACAQKKVAIKFSENYSINFTLGLAIVRGAYSIISLLAGLNNS